MTPSGRGLSAVGAAYHVGQKEMLMPITGKKPAKEAIAKKTAVEAAAQVGLAIPRGRPGPASSNEG